MRNRVEAQKLATKNAERQARKMSAIAAQEAATAKKRVDGQVAYVRKISSGISSSVTGAAGTGARYAAFGAAGAAAYAVKSGIQFNATMEQNQLAFTNFLGSAKAARQELQWLDQDRYDHPVRSAGDHSS